jgi:hypothetical protein
MLALFAAVRILPSAAKVHALAASEVILPGGTTGWVVKSRAQQALFLPLVLAALALISIRPLMNPDSRLFALVADAVLFGWIIVRLVLTFRNKRVVADRASITICALGRMRSWPVTDIELVAIVGVRWTDWAVPALLFIGRNGTELFRVTSLYWNLDEIGALCLRLGIQLSLDYVPARPRRINRVRLAMNLVVTLITAALLAVSFLPLPSGAG